jgi:hypothetical protein
MQQHAVQLQQHTIWLIIALYCLLAPPLKLMLMQLICCFSCLQEHYDYGGQGVGYNDSTPLVNTGNCALRPHDGVRFFILLYTLLSCYYSAYCSA